MFTRAPDRLIEEALTAWRPCTPDGRILPHPAWADLSPADRERLFEEAIQLRAFEKALDPSLLSLTSRLVLGRIRDRGLRDR